MPSNWLIPFSAFNAMCSNTSSSPVFPRPGLVAHCSLCVQSRILRTRDRSKRATFLPVTPLPCRGRKTTSSLQITCGALLRRARIMRAPLESCHGSVFRGFSKKRKERETDLQTDRQTGRRTDGPTDRQTDRQKESTKERNLLLSSPL